MPQLQHTKESSTVPQARAVLLYLNAKHFLPKKTAVMQVCLLHSSRLSLPTPEASAKLL
jgi:hypothetical protein